METISFGAHLFAGLIFFALLLFREEPAQGATPE